MAAPVTADGKRPEQPGVTVSVNHKGAWLEQQHQDCAVSWVRSSGGLRVARRGVIYAE